MKKFRYLWILGLIVFDQLIKLLIRKNMYVGETFAVIDRIFSITYVQNRGAQRDDSGQRGLRYDGVRDRELSDTVALGERGQHRTAFPGYVL